MLRNYDQFWQSEDCQDKEVMDIFLPLIGCEPIWFTNHPKHCGQKTISEKDASVIYDLFSGVDSRYFTSKCLPPCTAVDYSVEHLSTSVVQDGNEGVYIFVNQNVQITRESFAIDLFTLLNRLGGTIGICKEAFWCVLIIFGLIESATQILKAFLYTKTVASEGKPNI